MLTVCSRSVLIGTMCILISGCSSQQIARFEAKVGTMRCAKEGLVEGGAEHRDCVAAYTDAADRERTDTRAALLGVVGASTQVWSAEQQGRAAAAKTVPPGYRAYRLTKAWWDAGKRMCQYADGSVLNVGNATCPAELTASL